MEASSSIAASFTTTMDWRNLKNDRARAAYDHPLDGQFDDNVVQIKHGPIDFRCADRSPLFAGLG